MPKGARGAARRCEWQTAEQRCAAALADCRDGRDGATLPVYECHTQYRACLPAQGQQQAQQLQAEAAEGSSRAKLGEIC